MPELSRRNFLLGLLFPTLFASETLALDFKGIDYMPISELARTCGMRYRTVERDKVQRVFSKSSTLEFTLHSRQMQLNGKTVWLGHPVTINKGMLFVSRRDFKKTITPILYPQKLGKPPRLFSIVIDAGHGEKDNGAINKRLGLKEKQINLDIALRLGKILTSNGYKVSYTRNSDSFLELPDRIAKANRLNANLFISLHCNAATDSSVEGVETFAMTPQWMYSTAGKQLTKSDTIANDGNKYDDWSQLLSYYTQRAICTETGAQDRGAKRARFAVLRPARMPAILVEAGFISNTSEGRKLATSAYRQKIAEAIASGILNYHRTLRRLSK